jgi:hypothetical protein
MRGYLTALAIAGAGLAGAQVVVPNFRAASDGNSNFFLFVASPTTRTYQMTIAASQLTGLVNTNLSGVQFRMDSAATAAWPPVGGTMSQFDIFLGKGVSPTAQSTTFASNFVGAPTQVRSGSLTFNAGSFTVGGSPNAWGPTIGFTNNFLYTGGNLTIEYRFSGMPTGTVQPSLDACSADTGQGTDYVAQFAASNTATVSLGLNGRAVVTRFTGAAVPEPATMAALGLGVAALLRRRRK